MSTMCMWACIYKYICVCVYTWIFFPHNDRWTVIIPIIYPSKQKQGFYIVPNDKCDANYSFLNHHKITHQVRPLHTNRMTILAMTQNTKPSKFSLKHYVFQTKGKRDKRERQKKKKKEKRILSSGRLRKSQLFERHSEVQRHLNINTVK